MDASMEHVLLEARDAGREIVVVIGLGFVGTAVVANLSRTRDGEPCRFFVVGLDQDTPDGRAKCERLARGEPPVYADDISLRDVFAEAVHQNRNILGTVDPTVLGHADVVVSCINLDLKREPGQTEELAMHTDGYAALMQTVGRHLRPGALVTVESTLPLGMCDTVLYPALCAGQREQGVDVDAQPPLLAFCYERVMPGPGYLDSVNHYWRAYGGINAESAARARTFLSKFVDVEHFPLWEHKSTRAAEMAKLLENSYRATNIAFIEEWAKLAEAAGVDLFDVIASIRLRKGTHDNMMLPGLGVGGYCLTKDALLAAFGAEQLLHVPAELPFSRKAILTNERMPLRAVAWIQAHFDGKPAGKHAVLLGITYRPQVADTRSSASEIVADALLELGCTVTAYDPLLDAWDECPEVSVSRDPRAAITGADIVVICLPDKSYADFLADDLAAGLKSGAIVIDAWNLVTDDTARSLRDRGVTLYTYGRGDR